MLCRFCEIKKGNYHYKDVDQPIIENSDFYAIASIGALVEGWTLIIPKKHQLSMKKCFYEESFKEIVNELLPLMKSNYGTIVAFEHGSNQEGSPTACGTDHAHLHLVPFEILNDELGISGLQWQQCLSSKVKELTNGKEYLFYIDVNSIDEWKDPIGYLHILKKPISQYFRSLIAKKIGMQDESNYKNFPHLDNSVMTKKSLQKLIA